MAWSALWLLPDAYCPMPTRVMHIDVDAFFASVEQLRDPRLRGKPVAVGNGVVASPSYEARKLGVTTAMPIHQALRICPQLIVLDGRHDVYRCFTEATWEICRRYAPAWSESHRNPKRQRGRTMETRSVSEDRPDITRLT